MTFQPQPLRSHALYIFIKRVNLLIMPRGFRHVDLPGISS
jgi:hypothetical protein